MHCATYCPCALCPPMQAALWGGIALHWAVHPVFTLGDDYCCRTLTPVTQRSPTPHPARHNPKYNSKFTAPGPHSQRSHLGFTHTGAVVQAAAGAAWAAAATFCQSRPHGQGSAGKAAASRLGAGPPCSAAAAIVVHKMAPGPCARGWALYVYLMPTHSNTNWQTALKTLSVCYQCMKFNHH